MELTEFLLARIAEDEAWAESSSRHPDKGAFARDNYGILWVDPGRVLAECEAKRRVIEQLARTERLIEANVQKQIELSGDGLAKQEQIAALRRHSGELGGRRDALRFVVDQFVATYADHPDYREEWS